MPDFIVEDGTGLEDATSYVLLEYSNEYLGSDWADTDELKQANLIVATEYIDARWGSQLQGRPLVAEQSLEFPRSFVYDRYGNPVTGLPTDWIKAVCLYAKESKNESLYPANTTTAKDIKSKQTTVGPITTKVEYQGTATASSWLKFSLADSLARQYVYPGGSGVMRN